MTIEQLYKALKNSIEEFKPEEAKQITKKLLEAQIDPIKVLDDVLNPTMEEIGEKFDRMDIFLPELMGAAEAMRVATSVLTEQIKKSTITPAEVKGKVVLGTVSGDIHEIGKNIVKIMLEVSGFEVLDLGRDVPSLKFIEKAEEVNADVIALSALMTTTMHSQREVIELLEALGKRNQYLVIIGGNPTTDSWRKEIGADGWAETAVGAAKLVTKMIQEKVR